MDMVCTRKLSTQLRLTDLPKWTAQIPLSCWYGNMFSAPRQRFIIAMESTTCVIVLFPARGLTNPLKLLDTFRTTAFAYFARRGWDGLLGHRISFDNNPIRFWSASDRPLLGTITEMIRLAKYDIEEGMVDLMEVMDSTNDAPLSTIGMEAPAWILDRLTGRKPKPIM